MPGPVMMRSSSVSSIRSAPKFSEIVCPLIAGAKLTWSSPPVPDTVQPPAVASLVTAVIASRSEQFGGVNAGASEFTVTTAVLPTALALAAMTSDAIATVQIATSDFPAFIECTPPG